MIKRQDIQKIIRSVFGGGSDINAGNPLPANISELEAAYDSRYKFLKTYTFENIRPIGEINLYSEIPSGAASDTVLHVISGSGESTLTTFYVPDRHLVILESAGLQVEFSDPPDVEWVTTSAKYIKLQRKDYKRSGSPVEAEAKWGGSTSDEKENWRQIIALSDAAIYLSGFKKLAKDNLRVDLIAMGNYHYRIINLQGDEYIKLVADAGAFTYTNDVIALFIKGLLFDYDDILNMV